MVPKTGELISEFKPHCTHKNVAETKELTVPAVSRLIY